MKPDGVPRPAGGTSSEVTTRERVLAVVVEHGPVTSGAVARVLGLTAAAVRRHLDAMAAEGLVTGRDARPGPERRGPGRPPKEFVATRRASAPAGDRDGHADLAVDLLHHLAATAGRAGVRAYAEHRAHELRERYAPEVRAAGPEVTDRARALAGALGRDGFAASARPVDTGTGVAAVQLCQGRCPVQHAAAAFPELCEAETEAFSELLGVGTRRLATLGAGGRVCTTHVPTAPPDHDRPTQHHPAQQRSAQHGTTTSGAPRRAPGPAARRTPSSPEGPRG
ncbi:MarR family transcriptional regulator [uncultured Pseudokineococcus sp.]|uniref:helix-turn-helix transcriptional regulator n=1 Tax=uncultured Pseudokineococcus sp. TaxID=1642928 RepID=UPI00263A0BE9|nr:MarR family transcriptional regulator [uncultured Pseudokineococcus sp.]